MLSLSTPLVLVCLLLLAWIGSAQIGLILRVLRGDRFWPEDAPDPAPWDARGILGLLVFWVGAQTLVAFLFPRGGESMRSPRILMLMTAVFNVVVLAFGPWVLARGSKVDPGAIRWLGREPGRGFRMGVNSWPILAFWIYLVYFVALGYWGATKHPVEEWMRADRSPTTILLASITAVVLAPAAEEFMFRGALLAWLTKLCLTPKSREDGVESLDFPESEPAQGFRSKPLAAFWAANVLVSILFAGMHGPVWPSPIPLFFLSLGLGVLYQRTGGIAAPLGLHVVFNGITTVLMNLTLATGFDPTPPRPDPAPPAKSAPAEASAPRP